MGFYLGKVLGRLVSPIAFCLVGQLFGILLFALGARRLGGLVVVGSFVVLWAFSLPGLADDLRWSLERLHPAVPIESLPDASAILLLGGGTSAAIPPRLTVDLGPAADRVLYTARLFRAGKAPLVVVSGGSVDWLPEGSQGAPGMVSLLVEWGVPVEAMLIEAESRNTYENTQNSARLLAERGVEDVLLVTSAMHMRRALACCRSAGLRCHPAPTDFNIIERDSAGILDWMPDSQALDGSSKAIREWVGYLVYAMRGWIDVDASAGAELRATR